MLVRASTPSKLCDIRRVFILLPCVCVRECVCRCVCVYDVYGIFLCMYVYTMCMVCIHAYFCVYTVCTPMRDLCISGKHSITELSP